MQSEPHRIDPVVWALPRSLAATDGIIVIFSSSGYLDVSVRRVPSVWLWIHHTVTCSACRVSPFRHPRIKAYVQLPTAFRSLSRLSSAPSARASALRPTMLNLFVSPPLPFRFTRAVQKWFLHTSAGESAACVPLFFSLACYCFLDLRICRPLIRPSCLSLFPLAVSKSLAVPRYSSVFLLAIEKRSFALRTVRWSPAPYSCH